ncbi:hypothetical protein LRY65_02715 [Candidatus Woesebacteria bacterium]|nr:hypothetical protein [Candidatus Woesebacteria bacterium]MCD8527104.1 hypothetical protein [Candidatus Woesebacteria bacterium]MCD8546734.1 hypothetical protein [Candidatus Woesebacteria bacterium]
MPIRILDDSHKQSSQKIRKFLLSKLNATQGKQDRLKTQVDSLQVSSDPAENYDSLNTLRRAVEASLEANRLEQILHHSSLLPHSEHKLRQLMTPPKTILIAAFEKEARLRGFPPEELKTYRHHIDAYYRFLEAE